MVKIFLHRVTTHKIQIVPTILTLLILKVLQSHALALHATTQHLNIKENFLTTTTILLSSAGWSFVPWGKGDTEQGCG